MISLIIPTYNESENIIKLIPQIFEYLPSVNLIIVDDSSPDGTADIVKNLSARYPLKLIVRPKKSGLASAVLEGAKLAESDIIGVMDADFSHPPSLLPVMAKAAKDADIVVASRYVSGGKTIGWPSQRKMISRDATLLAKLLLRVRAKDPMSGFFFVKKSILLKTSVKASGYKLLLNILVANKLAKVVEVPYTFRERVAGKSKMSRREMANYIVTLSRLLRL